MINIRINDELLEGRLRTVKTFLHEQRNRSRLSWADILEFLLDEADPNRQPVQRLETLSLPSVSASQPSPSPSPSPVPSARTYREPEIRRAPQPTPVSAPAAPATSTTPKGIDFAAIELDFDDDE